MKKNIRTAPRAVHLFKDVFMGWSHESLNALLKEKTGKTQLASGEVAVFINKACTACKILAPGNNAFIYYRAKGGQTISAEAIRYLPALFGGARLMFGGSIETQVIKHLEARYSKRAGKFLKVAHA